MQDGWLLTPTWGVSRGAPRKPPARCTEVKPAPSSAHEGHMGTPTPGEVGMPFVAPLLSPGSGVLYVMGRVNLTQLILWGLRHGMTGRGAC